MLRKIIGIMVVGSIVIGGGLIALSQSSLLPENERGHRYAYDIEHGLSEGWISLKENGSYSPNAPADDATIINAVNSIRGRRITRGELATLVIGGRERINTFREVGTFGNSGEGLFAESFLLENGNYQILGEIVSHSFGSLDRWNRWLPGNRCIYITLENLTGGRDINILESWGGRCFDSGVYSTSPINRVFNDIDFGRYRIKVSNDEDEWQNFDWGFTIVKRS